MKMETQGIVGKSITTTNKGAFQHVGVFLVASLAALQMRAATVTVAWMQDNCTRRIP
jgi:hypothetical protein